MGQQSSSVMLQSSGTEEDEDRPRDGSCALHVRRRCKRNLEGEQLTDEQPKVQTAVKSLIQE